MTRENLGDILLKQLGIFVMQKWQLIKQVFRIIHAENVTLRRQKSRQIHDFSH